MQPLLPKSVSTFTTTRSFCLKAVGSGSVWNEKKLKEALLYYRKDRDLCIKLKDEVEEAEATRMIGKVLLEQCKCGSNSADGAGHADLT